MSNEKFNPVRNKLPYSKDECIALFKGNGSDLMRFKTENPSEFAIAHSCAEKLGVIGASVSRPGLKSPMLRERPVEQPSTETPVFSPEECRALFNKPANTPGMSVGKLAADQPVLFEIYRRSAVAAHLIEDRHPILTPEIEAKVKAQSAVIRGTQRETERSAKLKEFAEKQKALDAERAAALGTPAAPASAPDRYDADSTLSPTMRESLRNMDRAKALRSDENVYLPPEPNDVTKQR